MTLGRHPVLTPEKARQNARDALAEARTGDDPTAATRKRRASLTVSELVDEWLGGPGKRTRKGRVKSTHSFASDAGRLKCHVVPTIGYVRLCDLTRVNVEAVRDAVASGKTARPREKTKKRGVRHVRGGEGVATRTIITLSTLLGYAVERGLLERNMALGVHKAKERRCERFLSPDEIKALNTSLEVHRAAHPRAVDILGLLLLTGCRFSEIAGLKWAEVDLQAGLIVLRDSKTGARPVYLSDAATDALNGVWRIEGCPWVFPATRGDGSYQGTRKVWASVLKKAGLSGVRIHDLRHTFASTALANGASLPIIAKLLGHRELRTTARYAHLADDAVRAVANSVGRVVTGG
jgi:integrase